MEINGILSGLDKTLANIVAVQKKAAEAQSLGLTRSAMLTRDTIVHYAGAGHPDNPEVRSGRLKASIRYEPTTPIDKVYVGSDAEYAPPLEFGHMQVMAWGHRMKEPKPVRPYPFVRPAIAEVFDSGAAQKLFAGAVKEVLL